jgi:hypothetical protein
MTASLSERPCLDQDTLRERFNAAGFWARAERGEFTIHVSRDAPLDRSNTNSRFDNDPLCARSQIVRYLDGNGTTVAVVHQYIRQDGSQCARGKPDPKSLLLDGASFVRCKHVESA